MTGRAMALEDDPNNRDDVGRPLPLSDAVIAGDTLYLSGRVGIDPATGAAPADVDREIRLMLDSLVSVLAKADMTMDDLTSVQVYCTDLTLFDQFNRIYRGYFQSRFPARAFLGAHALLLD